MNITLDMAELTLGDMEDFESISGMSIGDLSDPTKMSSKATVAMIYIVKRKQDPTVTLDDIRNMKVQELTIELTDSAANPQ